MFFFKIKENFLLIIVLSKQQDSDEENMCFMYWIIAAFGTCLIMNGLIIWYVRFSSDIGKIEHFSTFMHGYDKELPKQNQQPVFSILSWWTMAFWKFFFYLIPFVINRFT